MAYYARVLNGVVEEVIVADQEFVDNMIADAPGGWIQTSYNTRLGVHKLGGTPLRKNYAGVGFIYDKDRDAFYEPQPYNSWILNEDTCQWEAPVAYPEDENEHVWNEEAQSWDVVADE